jgi:ribosomal protein S18 acetylase RimI-like enzyme
MTDGEQPSSLTAVEVDVADPDDPRAQHCLRAYFAELNRRFEAGYDPAAAAALEPHEMRLPAGLFLVATLNGEPVGCGALKFHAGRLAELKRMWVSPTARGLGLGRRLLRELEAQAAQHGSQAVRLDSNHTLTEAIALYRSAGYRPVAAFNDDPYADHWFEKDLNFPLGNGV